MKILVYNYQNQYALSRKQIETIKEILPKEYFSPIKEFHITPESPGQERFEYDYKTKIAYFEYKIEHKTIEIIADAIEHLLIGLKRIKEKDKFGYFIKESDKIIYEPFVEEWKQKCIDEFERIKNRR
jgi:hypothetical protein